MQVPEVDRRELQRRARDRGAPARVVERARIVLLAADEVPGKQIATTVGCAEGTVVTWRGRSPSTAWPDWRICRGRASRPSCPRRCGIGCWS
ncbi:helix-turn-helix domain-containing protein [Geodermatophilus sp. CPCC 205506]|uniref:helix-turn-helix domain-containing protein n=1 Tax=Geodermatophilus sp. CPCC 205506 TaxID=2936596 RepID=UPI003EEAF49C